MVRIHNIYRHPFLSLLNLRVSAYIAVHDRCCSGPTVFLQQTQIGELSMISERQYLSAAEAARLVGISLAGFWRAVRDGRLPPAVYPLSRAPRWSRNELLAALEATRALPRKTVARRRAARAATVAAE
jgi:predicted DNA-binding transcriptional regulator AlpA